MTYAVAERIADAVLYESYTLRPDGASAAMNRLRWPFGVVAPRPPHEDGEPWFARTECVVEVGRARSAVDRPALSVRARFLRPRPTSTGWLEGIPHAVDLDPIALDTLPLKRVVPIRADAVAAHVVVHAARADDFVKVLLTLENDEPWRGEFGGNRDAMLAHSLVAAHLLLALDGAAFVSLLEPPASAAAVAATCENRHTWPVLVGDRPRRNLMLSSPGVMYDYPAVARESRGDRRARPGDVQRKGR